MKGVAFYELHTTGKPKRVRISAAMAEDNGMCRFCRVAVVKGWPVYRCCKDGSRCSGTRDMACFTQPKDAAAVERGRKGGSVCSEAKAAAVRLNGRKSGGRPKKRVCQITQKGVNDE